MQNFHLTINNGWTLGIRNAIMYGDGTVLATLSDGTVDFLIRFNIEKKDFVDPTPIEVELKTRENFARLVML